MTLLSEFVIDIWINILKRISETRIYDIQMKKNRGKETYERSYSLIFIFLIFRLFISKRLLEINDNNNFYDYIYNGIMQTKHYDKEINNIEGCKILDSMSEKSQKIIKDLFDTLIDHRLSINFYKNLLDESIESSITSEKNYFILLLRLQILLDGVYFVWSYELKEGLHLLHGDAIQYFHTKILSYDFKDTRENNGILEDDNLLVPYSIFRWLLEKYLFRNSDDSLFVSFSPDLVDVFNKLESLNMKYSQENKRLLTNEVFLYKNDNKNTIQWHNLENLKSIRKAI